MALIYGASLLVTSHYFYGLVVWLALHCSWESQPSDSQQIQYFSELAYYPTAFFTKTSILCLIARIFAPHRKTVLLARVIIGLMLLYYIPAFFIKIFRCNPIHKTWDINARGKCITSESAIFLADCLVSLVTDLAILIMPMPLVWQLQASLRRKLRIMAIFAGGILCVHYSYAPPLLEQVVDR